MMMDFSGHHKTTPDKNIPGGDKGALSLAKSRLMIVAGFLMMGYLAVSLRLVDLTLLRTSPATPTETPEQAARPAPRQPLRGSIVDRNGALIATSLKMASVYADTTLIDDPEKLAADVSAILAQQDKGELVKKFSSGKKFVWVRRDITPREEYEINALGNPALGFHEEDRRIYPGTRLTSHLAGYTDVDGKGISGIEKNFERELASGETDIALTIDLRVQHTLRRELSKAMETFSARNAAGIVLDVNTGEIIAMVSLPDFNPYHLNKTPEDAKFNRASLGVFEMGSTFKLFSTAAALDSGQITFGTAYDTTEPIRYGRFTISDYHAKSRVMTVPEIFMYSSNIGTARMAQATGTARLQDFYRALGFFEKTPLEIPEKGLPLYPDPWRDISTLTASFGHGIAVTPVHVARAAAAIVNGGILVTPTLVLNGKNRISLVPAGKRVMSPQTSDMMRQLLRLVVAAGTGSKAFIEGYDVGGKTGTAEKNTNGRYIKDAVLSSFIGVFPMQHPRFVVLAILDEPKPAKETFGYVTGGWTAAPVVARVIERMGPLYGIPPDFDAGRDITKVMSPYVKDLKEGNGLAALGTDR